jgi:hypothetical protein
VSLTLEAEIRKLLTELKNLKLSYEERDKNSEKGDLIRQGKYEAYRYVEDRLSGILDWLGIER